MSFNRRMSIFKYADTKKNLLKSSLLGVGLSFLLPRPSSARDTTAVVGSVIIIENYSALQITDNSIEDSSVTLKNQNRIAPFMDGLALPSSSSQYSCLDPASIREVDGWKGIEISSIGIIGGVTGSITGAITNIFSFPDDAETFEDALRTTFQGGIHYNARGYTTPIGDTSAEAANNLCAGATMPYELNYFTAPNTNTIEGYYIGNRSGVFDGNIWIYVPISIAPGTYQLVDFGITQGSSRLLRWNGYLPITTAADTVTVVPPPCTISTTTEIGFDTHSEAGKTVSAPLTFQCDDVPDGTLMDAHIIANAVGTTVNPSELPLSYSSNSQSGGIVRGYIGPNAMSNNCTDTNESLFFDGRFGAKLGSLPMVIRYLTHWYGNYVPQVMRYQELLRGVSFLILVINNKH